MLPFDLRNYMWDCIDFKFFSTTFVIIAKSFENECVCDCFFLKKHVFIKNIAAKGLTQKKLCILVCRCVQKMKFEDFFAMSKSSYCSSRSHQNFKIKNKRHELLIKFFLFVYIFTFYFIVLNIFKFFFMKK